MSDATISLRHLERLSTAERAALLERAEVDLDAYLPGARDVVEAVRRDGDTALARFAGQFDGASIAPDAIAVCAKEIDEAFDLVGRDMIATLEYAADNIRSFHEAQLPKDMWLKEIRPGVLAGERWTPVDSAALYSPRGKGSFPSITLMTAIPAVVAGVSHPIILTPTGPDGRVDAATLVAARLSGVERVFRAGGAAAVAAAAFGTASVPRCTVFEGPGSPWVSAAKQILRGSIASQIPAGPSEAVLLADETADPMRTALDLLIEAEHGGDSSVHLVCWHCDFAQQVADLALGLLERLSPVRRGFALAVLSGQRGGVLVTPSAMQAYDFVNDYAPEHLQILSTRPFDHLPHLRHASEILLGEHVPGSVANYLLGPNAVLPTNGGARWSSPLGVRAFQKSASIAHVTAAGYAELAKHTHRFATYEGFEAHAMAVSSLRP